VLRETHETPENVSRRLMVAGGTNRFGEANYRAVWGWNRLAWIGGKWEDKDESGALIREVVQLRLEPKYPAVNRWHVERWVAPEAYGPPQMWYAHTLEIEGRKNIPALGPYPVRGEYEHCFTLQGQGGEFVQLTQAIAEHVARAIEVSRGVRKASSRAALYAREAKAEADYENWAIDSMESPAFHGVPFVGVA